MKGTAVITGATAGIGWALAEEFASHDHDVVLVARDEDRLAERAESLATGFGITATAVTMDLTEDDAPERLFETFDDRDLEPSIFVNNAGRGLYGRFGETDLAAERSMVQLNVEALLALSHRFLSRNPEGHLLNVGSVAGYFPGPFMAGYYASKAHVNSLTQAIAVDQPDATVTLLAPGPVATEFHERAGMDPSTLGDWITYSPERVAAAGYAGLASGNLVVVPGFVMRTLVHLKRVTPGRIQRWGARLINRGR